MQRKEQTISYFAIGFLICYGFYIMIIWFLIQMSQLTFLLACRTSRIQNYMS